MHDLQYRIKVYAAYSLVQRTMQLLFEAGHSSQDIEKIMKDLFPNLKLPPIVSPKISNPFIAVSVRQFSTKILTESNSIGTCSESVSEVDVSLSMISDLADK